MLNVNKLNKCNIVYLVKKLKNPEPYVDWTEAHKLTKP